MANVREGLDLTNLNQTSKEEIDANLISVWGWRGPLYELYANSLMLDFAPDFAKLHRWASDMYGRPSAAQIITLSLQNVHSYIMLAWETGILNEFHTMRRWGLPKEQFMEIVMHTQLTAGMRGLGHVYHAIGNLLPVFAEPEKPSVEWPEGWAPDMGALKSGIELTSRKMSEKDTKNLKEWYEKTLGMVPNSIMFGLKHHPEFVKVHRAKWEASIKTLPKQVIPYMALRHHMITGSREGLREAALLARAWGISKPWIVKGITGSAFFFTSFEGLYAAHDAVEDILDSMPD